MCFHDFGKGVIIALGVKGVITALGVRGVITALGVKGVGGGKK